MHAMKPVFLTISLAFALATVPVTSRADADLQFARAKQCMACHQVDTKRVGPALSVVAERYADAPGAKQYLADAIRQGSRSKWGAIPMPAQPQVNPDDALRLASWILTLVEGADSSIDGDEL